MFFYRVHLYKGTVCICYYLMPYHRWYLQSCWSCDVGGLCGRIINMFPVDSTAAIEQQEDLRIFGRRYAFMVMSATHRACLTKDNELLPMSAMLILSRIATLVQALKRYRYYLHYLRFRSLPLLCHCHRPVLPRSL